MEDNLVIDSNSVIFGRVPDWLDDSDVKDNGMRLYIHLMRRYGGMKKGIFPSQATLAKALRRKERAIYDAQKELMRVGALRIVRRGFNKTNLYYLAYDKPFEGENVKDE